MSWPAASRRRSSSRASRTAAVLSLLSACSASTPPLVGNGPPHDAIVYVIERGWHTDIGLPVEEITGGLTTFERGFPGVQFLTFGFGERQFLIDRRVTFCTVLSALLPSRSALLVTAVSATPQAAFGAQHLVALYISRASLERIEARLWQEFEQSSSGNPVQLADGPYSGSVFYAARHTYDGFYTCNTWTTEVLHAGGLPMPTAGVLFVSQVMGMARWIGAQQASLRRG